MYKRDTHELVELWEARTCSRQNRYERGVYPFAGMASEHRLDNFQPDTAHYIKRDV
jgi:hypothetical protein